MPRLRILSAVAQVAAHLREKLVRKHWTGTMPGVLRLEEELGVNRKTVEAALRQLEHEGLLAGQGPGRKRLIIRNRGRAAVRPMRVAILLGAVSDRKPDYIVELQHALLEAGHAAFFPAKGLLDLGMDGKRVARLVGQTAADAWLVLAGSREVLEWFGAQTMPSFALFGHRAGLPISATGPNKAPAISAATRQLLTLGHRRIALLCRKLRRLPEPGGTERAFLDELAAHGLATGAFNLPDWDETIGGFHDLLGSLFRVTPPTALIVDEAPQFVATLQFLARRGIPVPEKVSLICTDPDPAFAWCKPTIAHIRWDSRPLVRRIVRWAANVSHGRTDVRQTFVPAEFVAGGTIGPVPKG